MRRVAHPLLAGVVKLVDALASGSWGKPFIESVVLATDLSEGAELAFAHALAVAVLRRARLTLLHVTSDDEVDKSQPAVRATLARWHLLEPGGSQEAVFERSACA